MTRRLAAAALVVLVALSGLGAGATLAAQSGEFQLSVSPSVETPERTVTLEGQDYTVTAVGRVEPGGELDVNVAAPDGATYRVYLYNKDRVILDSRRLSGTASATFPTEGFTPGSYMLAVDHEGVFEDLHPVVISAYRLTVDAPARGESGGTLSVDVSLTEVAGDRELDRVQVVVADDGEASRTVASRTAEGEYEASIDLDGLSPDTYSIYAVAQGTEEVFGGKELLGMSDSNALTVTEPTTTSPPPDDGDDDDDDDDDDDEEPSGGGGGDGDGEATSTPTDPTPGTVTTGASTATDASPTTTLDETPATTAGPETPTTAPGTTRPPATTDTPARASTAASTASSPEPTDAETQRSTTAESDVITPRSPGTAGESPSVGAGTETTADEPLGLGLLGLVVAIALLARRRMG